MTKLKICFVDDRLAPLNDFLGWSYIKKKEIIDNFIQNNETVIIKEISEELGITLQKLNFEKIKQNISLPFYNHSRPILKKMSCMLWEYEKFEAKFVRKLSEVGSSNDLLVLDIMGVFDNYENLPNIPFIIFSGYADEGIDTKIKSHNKFITAYTKNRDNFELLMSGIEKCAKNNQINTECFDIISPQRIKTTLLHLFLPLDIDMQALEIIKDDPGEVKKYLWGDKDRDIEGMFESREGNEHYRQKLYDLWHLLGKQDYLRQIGKKASSKVERFTPIDNSSPLLQKLAGLDDDPKESPVYNFLESLDTGKKDDRDVTAEDLCMPFNLKIEVNGKKEEIKSFHNWYCALASCLRGAEGCEGK